MRSTWPGAGDVLTVVELPEGNRCRKLGQGESMWRLPNWLMADRILESIECQMPWGLSFI